MPLVKIIFIGIFIVKNVILPWFPIYYKQKKTRKILIIESKRNDTDDDTTENLFRSTKPKNNSKIEKFTEPNNIPISDMKVNSEKDGSFLTKKTENLVNEIDDDEDDNSEGLNNEIYELNADNLSPNANIEKRNDDKDAEPKVWDHWGKWSECSVTCGIGKQTRWRHCVSGSCARGEKEAQIKSCTFPAC